MLQGRMKSPNNILSIVKVPKAAASGAGNLRSTPTRTSIRVRSTEDSEKFISERANFRMTASGNVVMLVVYRRN